MGVAIAIDPFQVVYIHFRDYCSGGSWWSCDLSRWHDLCHLVGWISNWRNMQIWCASFCVSIYRQIICLNICTYMYMQSFPFFNVFFQKSGFAHSLLEVVCQESSLVWALGIQGLWGQEHQIWLSTGWVNCCIIFFLRSSMLDDSTWLFTKNHVWNKMYTSAPYQFNWCICFSYVFAKKMRYTSVN